MKDYDEEIHHHPGKANVVGRHTETKDNQKFGVYSRFPPNQWIAHQHNRRTYLD